MVNVKTELVYVDVSGQTPCYRGDAVKIFDKFINDYGDYVID